MAGTTLSIKLNESHAHGLWTGICKDRPLLLISLTYLSIWLQQLTSLLHLQIRGCPKLQFSTGSVLQRLISLKELGIYSCGRLQSLTEAGLHHLTTLETLSIIDCPKLLSSLYVRKCPSLEQRCQFEKGQEWRYISHIPKIVIDDVLF
ncbi:hypothetical protein AAG906_022953 [Vitis piasezkii]